MGGGGIKYFVFSDFCNKYLCWYTLLYQILISLKCHIKRMFLNTKKSSGSCLSASFFKQTVVDATPHVEKETFQCITLARAPTRCWHVGTKISRIKYLAGRIYQYTPSQYFIRTFFKFNYILLCCVTWFIIIQWNNVFIQYCVVYSYSNIFFFILGFPRYLNHEYN